MENSSQLKVSPCLLSTPLRCVTFQSALLGFTILKERQKRRKKERRERRKEGGRKEARKKEREGWRDKGKKKITFLSSSFLISYHTFLFSFTVKFVETN